MVNPENNIFCRLDGLTAATREQQRVTTLEHLGLLTATTVAVFDEAAQTAARLLETPIGFVGLMVKDQLRLKSAVGLSEMGLMNSFASSRRIPRAEAFCTYVVDSQQALTINDCAIAPLFSHSTLFQHHKIRAYLGVPLLASNGQCLGTLAVMDLRPRNFTQKEVELLSLTARWSLSEFERDRLLVKQEKLGANSPVQQPELREIADLSPTSHRRDRSFSLAEPHSHNTTDTLKVQLLTRLTEELRTPLTSVMGMARILEREVYGALADKQKEYVGVIHNSGQHLLSLVEEIVSLGVFEDNSASLRLAPVDVEMLCQQAINNLFQIAKQERQQLRLSVEPGNRIWLLDKDKVRQTLYYLVFTVIQSSEAGSEVCIHVSRKEGTLNISVWASHPWLGDGLPQVEISSQALDAEGSAPWQGGTGERETKREAKSSLNHQILCDVTLSPLEKAQKLKQKSTNESYRQLLGLILSCHLAEVHGGEISIQGSSHSGYRYVFKLPKMDLDEG